MKILVLNCGSSSIKYALYNMDDKSVMSSGGAERVGLDGAFVKVKLANGDGRELKPSHDVKVGERYSLNIDQLHQEVEVLALPPNRVGAPLVQGFMSDRTPEEEYERIRMARQYAFEKRDRGVGRPTKRERREIEEFKYK